MYTHVYTYLEILAEVLTKLIWLYNIHLHMWLFCHIASIMIHSQCMQHSYTLPCVPDTTVKCMSTVHVHTINC